MKKRPFIFVLMACVSLLTCARTYAISWGPPTNVSDPTKISGGDISFAMNDNDVAVAAWVEFDGANTRIAVSLYSAGAWGPSSIVSDAGMNSDVPEIALNENDHAVVVWTCENAGSFEVRASYFDGMTWSSPVMLNTSGEFTDCLSLAMNDFDNAHAVWEVQVPGGSEIHASYFTGGVWSSEQKISANGAPSKKPNVTMNNAGEAFVVWQAYNGTNQAIEVVSFDGTSWSIPSVISSPGVEAFQAKVRINASGNAMAAWLGQPPNGGNTLQVVSYDAGTSTWGTPTDLSSWQNAEQIDLAFNDSGNAAVAWQKFSGSNFVIVSRVYLSNVWGTETTLSSLSANSKKPAISMSNLDQIVLSFFTATGRYTHDVNAVVYEGGAWGTATRLSAMGIDVQSQVNTLNNMSKTFVGWIAIVGNSEVRASLGTVSLKLSPGHRTTP